MSVWVTDLGGAAWTSGVHSRPASVSEAPGSGVSGASPVGTVIHCSEEEDSTPRDSRDPALGVGGRSAQAPAHVACPLVSPAG